MNEELNKKKVYIAGKITGMEEEAKVLFQQAENLLKEKGYTPINPFKLDHSHHDKSWESYMKVCLKALMDCDMIYPLDNHMHSRGAREEVSIARTLKIPRLYYVENSNQFVKYAD